MEKSERIALYEARYTADFGFEAVMVSARQQLLLELLRRLKPGVVLEVGCGTDLLVRHAVAAGMTFEQWIIVEPGERLAAAAQAANPEGVRLDVIRGFIEDSVGAVANCCIRRPGFVVCAGLLHEVEDPVAILRAARSLVAGGGIVHVSVPNALSLHRRLAKAMSIIRDEKQLSDRNRQLSQYRVFDLEDLVEVSARAGFGVVDRGGYFIKPFTHAQMQVIQPLLPEQVMQGLWLLGRALPELASEIYVNLRSAE